MRRSAMAAQRFIYAFKTGAAGDVLEFLWTALGDDRKVEDLTGAVSAADDRASINDRPGAYSCADGDEDQILLARPRVLSERREVDVVPHFHRCAERLMKSVCDAEGVPAGEVRGFA